MFSSSALPVTLRKTTAVLLIDFKNSSTFIPIQVAFTFTYMSVSVSAIDLQFHLIKFTADVSDSL